MIAGGTDVMVDIKYKEEPGALVNIKKIPGLSGIQENGGSLRIGPLMTIREIETSALVRDKLPVLWEACASVRVAANPQHRHHRRKHMPRLAVGRNLDAAAGARSQSQIRFFRWREKSSRSLPFSKAPARAVSARKAC